MSNSQIRDIPLFVTLPDEAIQHLESSLRRIDLPEKSVLFNEGDKGDTFYIILDGRVEIIKALNTENERLLAIREQGDFLGEMGLLIRDGRRTASVRTLTQVQLLEISHLDFDLLIKEWPTLALDMLREVSNRLRESQNATIRDLSEKNRLLSQAYQELQAAQAQIIEKEKLERELSVARRIQQSILPRHIPRISGLECGAIIESARQVGGDFFDFIPLEKGKCAVVVGDVTDKGVPAAIFMALTRSLIRAKVTASSTPAQVLQRVNRLLIQIQEGSMFATVLFAICDTNSRNISFGRAGHELPLIYYPTGERVNLSPASGQPIGLFDKPIIDEQSIPFPPGSTMIMYTDGATDAMNEDGELFGSKRLIDTIHRDILSIPQSICDHLFNRIQEFQGNQSQSDDITLVAIRATEI